MEITCFKDFTIQDYKYREEILSSIYNILNYYIQKHSKAMIVRFDIRYPLLYTDICTNIHISSCIELVIRKYKRQGLDPYYIWVREQDTSIHPHYHCALLLDAQKIMSYAHVMDTAESVWGHVIKYPVSGCVHNCIQPGNPDSNGKIIRRDVTVEEYSARCQDVFNQLTYLAKAQTKAVDNDGMRNFGMSRIQ